MSSSGKKAKHDKKMARKRQLKLQRKAAYAALAGASKKKKRTKGKGGPTKFRKSHAMEDCGNPGCKRCYPQLNAGSFGKQTHSPATI